MLGLRAMRGVLQLVVSLLIASAAVAQPAAAPAGPPFAPAAADERVAYRGATLIDGSGARPRRDMAVITRKLEQSYRGTVLAKRNAR